MKSLISALNEGRLLVSDGAWGTELHKRGLEAGECPELWNITHRSQVFSVAKGYVDAGADIILTNSFGGNPTKLAHYGLDNRTTELNEAAAAISREAAGAGLFVLGSMGPTGVVLMMGEVPEEVLYDGFCRQARALEQGGADALCIETMSAIDEACLAIKAARASTQLEIACTFTFEKGATGDYRTMMGVSPSDMARAVKEAGADVIGTNCGNGIDGMVDVVREIRAADAATPLLVHANAGKPAFQNGVTVFPESPDMMAAKVRDLIAAGANIIGGCCGTTPEHIKAIAAKIKR
jgi:5-methyltetrahydrofolate--homocysteine methyltransferase